MSYDPLLGAVAVIVIVPTGRERPEPEWLTVMVLDEKRFEETGDQPRWKCPGGGIEPGEAPRHAAWREVWEETGISLTPSRIKLLRKITKKNRARAEYPMYFFVAEVDNLFGLLPRGPKDGELTGVCDIEYLLEASKEEVLSSHTAFARSFYSAESLQPVPVPM